MTATVPATAAHAAALAAIHAAAFPRAERWNADVMALQIAAPAAFALLDARGGMVLARVAADEAEVLTLAVAPAVRRQGIAAALLRAAMAAAAARGARRMFLDVAAANVAARALYERAGFAEIGVRRRYYADGGDALVLRAALDARAAPPHGPIPQGEEEERSDRLRVSPSGRGRGLGAGFRDR